MSKMWITVVLALAIAQAEGFSLFPKRITLKLPIEAGPRYSRSPKYYSKRSNAYSQPSYSQSFSSPNYMNYNNMHSIYTKSQYFPSIGANYDQYYSGGYHSPTTHQLHYSNVQGYNQYNQAAAGRYNVQYQQQYYSQPPQISQTSSQGWSSQHPSQYQPQTSQHLSQQSTYHVNSGYSQQYDDSHQAQGHSSHYEAPKEISQYERPQESNQYQHQQGSSQYQHQQGSSQYQHQQGSSQYQHQQGSRQYQPQQESSQYQHQQGSSQYQPQQGSSQYQHQQESNRYEAPQESHHNLDSQQSQYQVPQQPPRYSEPYDESAQQPIAQVASYETPPPLPSDYNNQPPSLDYSSQQINPDASQDLSYQPYNDNGEIQGTAEPVPIPLGSNSVLQPYSQSGGLSSSTFENLNGQPTLVTKHVYFHVPPPDIEEPAPAPPPPPPPPTKNVNIIFIKTPNQENPNYAEQIQQQLLSQVPDEEKTLIYVLVKKPDPPAEPLPPPPPVLHKPEVFFIKYKTQKEDEYRQEENVEQHEHY